MPLVSVIVPVYKAENFLRKCTDSILNQTMTDFELILVEDGSPDASGALCDAIATEDSRVRVIHKPNGGVSTARNMGMAQATGKYIAFADSDDWFAPDMLKTLVEAAETNGADSAGCAHFNVLESGESWAEKPAMPAGIYEKDAIINGIVDPLVGDRLGKGGEILNGADLVREHFERLVGDAHALHHLIERLDAEFAGALQAETLLLRGVRIRGIHFGDKNDRNILFAAAANWHLHTWVAPFLRSARGCYQ